MKDYFSFELSPVVERLVYEELPTEIQSKLCNGFQYNPDTHDVYRVPIGMKIAEREPIGKNKKHSVDAVDRVLIEVKPSHSSIAIAGIYPTETLYGGQPSLDLAGTKVLFAFNAKLVKFVVEGIIKSRLRAPRHEIIAMRLPQLVQWIYTRHYLKKSKSFDNYILCIVPRSQNGEQLYLFCRAGAKDNKRHIGNVVNRRVAFPAQ